MVPVPEYSTRFKYMTRLLMKMLDCTYIGRGPIPNLTQFRRQKFRNKHYEDMIKK